jgi:hypothetical protein
LILIVPSEPKVPDSAPGPSRRAAKSRRYVETSSEEEEEEEEKVEERPLKRPRVEITRPRPRVRVPVPRMMPQGSTNPAEDLVKSATALSQIWAGIAADAAESVGFIALANKAMKELKEATERAQR